MKIKFIPFLFFTICCLLFFGNSLYIDSGFCFSTDSSSAKSMCLIEANSGRLIYEKNKDLQLAMASTTKIVTAITVIENYKGDIDTRLLIPEQAVGIEGTSIYLRSGEELSIRELLYGLMLPSGNDCAVALAILTSVSVEIFVEQMNDMAKKIGAENSHFANPHGLDADGHYTSAYDLALISAYAMKNTLFYELAKCKNYEVPPTEKNATRYLRNKNKLLFMNDKCVGIKIGFTDDAGRCLVSAMEDEGKMLICVVLNCSGWFDECDYLLNKANKEYTMINVLESKKYVTSLSVLYGDKNYARIYNKSEFLFPLTEVEQESLRIEKIVPNQIEAPIELNQIVGKIQVFINNDLIFESELCSIDCVERISNFDKLTDILDKWI